MSQETWEELCVGCNEWLEMTQMKEQSKKKEAAELNEKKRSFEKIQECFALHGFSQFTLLSRNSFICVMFWLKFVSSERK